YEKIKNSFLNKIIRFETVLTAIQYFSWAKVGKPYMGVGRNLAYKKSVFFDNRGFMNHMKIKSGDDDLFI
ncbi:MAG TPA: glycosyl transferase family 2, partial [Flavobacterium sp.]|nr:glycosyl transferase family 2 [Flavobacterium sp.]